MNVARIRLLQGWMIKVQNSWTCIHTGKNKRKRRNYHVLHLFYYFSSTEKLISDLSTFNLYRLLKFLDNIYQRNLILDLRIESRVQHWTLDTRFSRLAEEILYTYRNLVPRCISSMHLILELMYRERWPEAFFL